MTDPGATYTLYTRQTIDGDITAIGYYPEYDQAVIALNHLVELSAQPGRPRIAGYIGVADPAVLPRAWYQVKVPIRPVRSSPNPSE